MFTHEKAKDKAFIPSTRDRFWWRNYRVVRIWSIHFI